MNTITKEFTFDAAHRLLDYNGPCGVLHGHTYTVSIGMDSSTLDNQGFVVDYGIIKEVAKGWVDEHWDHGLILNSQDPLVNVLKDKQQKLYLFAHINPTAENIAEHLFSVLVGPLQKMAKENLPILHCVTIKETPTSSATYYP